MDYEMKMPDLATTGSPMRVVRWLVSVGQTVARGDQLVEVETDKAVMNVESPADGTLVEIAAPVDTVVLLGQRLGTIRPS